jgi:hypothetical protein
MKGMFGIRLLLRCFPNFYTKLVGTDNGQLRLSNLVVFPPVRLTVGSFW